MSSDEDSDSAANVSQRRTVTCRLQIWDHFFREDRKYQKTKHWVATCKSCVLAGKKTSEIRGEKLFPLKHLLGCVHVPPEVKKQHKQPDGDGAPPPTTLTTKRASSGNQNTAKRSSTQANMLAFLDRPLSSSETSQLERLLAEFFIDCNVAFKSIEKPSLVQLLTFLRPSVKLPGRTTFRTRIISGRIAEAQSEIEQALKGQSNVTLTFDGFKNVSKNKLLGKNERKPLCCWFVILT